MRIVRNSAPSRRICLGHKLPPNLNTASASGCARIADTAEDTAEGQVSLFLKDQWLRADS